MAKKEKIQLTPEEIAAKKLRTKKGWARFGAVALAIVITGAVYVIGSKDGPKVVVEPEDPPVIQQIIQQNPTPATTKAPETTKAPAPTTKAAEPTTKPTTAPTTAANNSSSGGGGILDTITGLLGGLGDFDIGSLLGGLGGDGGGLGGLVDRNSIADTVEGAGGKAKDFFYGLADNVEENEGLDGINEQIRDKIGGIGGDSGSGDSSNPLSGVTDSLGDIGDTISGITGGNGDGGSPLSGITDALGGLTGGDGSSPLSGITDALGGLLGGLGG